MKTSKDDKELQNKITTFSTIAKKFSMHIKQTKEKKDIHLLSRKNQRRFFLNRQIKGYSSNDWLLICQRCYKFWYKIQTRGKRRKPEGFWGRLKLPLDRARKVW